MKRNSFKKVIAALLASATVATMGLAATACGNKHTHNFEPDWDANNHWTVCKEDGEKTAAEPHVDANSDGKCDVCSVTMTPSGGNGGEQGGNGGEQGGNGGEQGGNGGEQGGNGGEQGGNGGEQGGSGGEQGGSGENQSQQFVMYIHVNTSILTSGVQAGRNSYRVYAHGTDTIFGGDFLNSELLVDDDDPNDDWYKVSIDLSKLTATGSYNLIVHNKWKAAPDATVDSGEQYDACSFTIEDNGKYIGKYINIKGDSKAAVEAAEAEYEENQSHTAAVKLHVQVDTSTVSGSNFYVYVYRDGSPVGFGGWPGTELTAEGTHSGWYSADVDLPTVHLDKNCSVIINNNSGSQYDTAEITFTSEALECWITIANVASYTAPAGY